MIVFHKTFPAVQAQNILSLAHRQPHIDRFTSDRKPEAGNRAREPDPLVTLRY
jgi:hypothetical protein